MKRPNFDRKKKDQILLLVGKGKRRGPYNSKHTKTIWEHSNDMVKDFQF